MKAVFARNGPYLIAADPQAEDFLASLKPGEGAVVSVKRHRNVRFHRKFFALLHLVFDVWEPAGEKTYRGETLRKDFERFREDILILAGHYEASYGINGQVRLSAKSISFAACDEDTFKGIYEAVLDVVWERILRDANFRSKAEVEMVVNQLMEFGH